MLIAFNTKVQSEIRKRRSRRSCLVDWAGQKNKVLLIPTAQKKAWEVTLRCDGVLLARVVDPVLWAEGKDCSDGTVLSAPVASLTDAAVIARGIDRLLRTKTVLQEA